MKRRTPKQKEPKASYLTLPEDTPEARAYMSEARKIRLSSSPSKAGQLTVLANALERLERKAFKALKPKRNPSQVAKVQARGGRRFVVATHSKESDTQLLDRVNAVKGH